MSVVSVTGQGWNPGGDVSEAPGRCALPAKTSQPKQAKGLAWPRSSPEGGRFMRTVIRWVVAFVLMVHGLIHLLGAAKGFGWADVSQPKEPISAVRSPPGSLPPYSRSSRLCCWPFGLGRGGS